MCGLFGFIASENPVNLDLKSLVTLGTFNDYRGGDSVGILVDNNIEYGVDTKKHFSTFYKSSKLLVNNKKVNYVLGHTRKASVGKVSLENAQPICIYNEKQELEFVLLHNGTISNYKELAKKYLDGEHKDFTDSMIMAYILYYHGYDVFKEYYGAGMFITCDYRKDKDNPLITFFKGASKDTNFSKDVIEERPLYFLKTKDGFWFSSIKTALEIINFGKKDVISNLNTNVLAQYKNGKIISAKVLDRSHMHQSQVYGYAPHTYNEYNGRNVTSSSLPVNTNRSFDTIGVLPINGLKSTHKLIDYLPKFDFEIKFKDNKYYYNNELMDGIYYLSSNGLVADTKRGETWNKAIFFNGVLVNGESVYFALKSTCDILSQTVEEFETDYTHLIYKYSNQLLYVTNNFFSLNSDNKFKFFSGVYYPLFVYNDFSFGVHKGSVKYYFTTSKLSQEGLILYYKNQCEENDKLTPKDYELIFLENLN